MTKRILVTTFAHEEDLLRTARELRKRGLRILDAYTPYPVHGLDEAIGLAPSRLGWACALLGATGAGFMVWFQHWTSAVDWPINVGGKPWNSLPAFAPVIFESMVLAAGVGTVLLFFIVSRLRPGRTAKLIAPDITDDRFALVIEETDAAFDVASLHPLLHHNHALQIEERAIDSGAAGIANAVRGTTGERSGSDGSKVLNYALAGLLALVVVAAFALPSDSSRRNWEVLPNMVWSPAYDAYEARAELLPENSAMPGAIARGQLPLDYAPTPEGAKQAGEEFTNPFDAEDSVALPRGGVVYQNFCASCHGTGGQGDGPVTKRGFPPPPSFQTGNARNLPDGQLFHIITYGQRPKGNMPPHGPLLDPDDRWKVILHIRSLQGPPPTGETTGEPSP